MKKIAWIFLLFLLIGQVQLQLTNAEDDENIGSSKSTVFKFLQAAKEAQLSLGRDFHTEDELKAVLSPYFTESYQQLFIDEHLFLEPQGYILYGTDFMPYFIPNYSYDLNTEIMTSNDEIIVYEYFPPQLEGPVVWETGLYEILILTKTIDGWKVTDYDVSTDEPRKHSY